MKETFEIAAIRMANVVLSKAHKGQLEEARKLARVLLSYVQPEDELNHDQLTVHVRWMIRRDLPQVLDIESQSNSFPWDEETFVKRLRRKNCISLVAEHEDKSIGFIVYELFERHIQIEKLAVGTQWRGRGVCRQLIARMESKLSAKRRSRLVYPVDEYDKDRHLALSACGFRCTGIEDDSYVFEFRHPQLEISL